MSSGETIWTDDPPFPENAKRALTDSQLRRNLRKATTTIRERRDGLIGEMADWQELRAAGAAIKDDVLRNLDRYLEQFEQAATAHGAQVHWARDADEANSTVASLIEATGEREVIKVKSMATQEIGLVPALARRGIEAYETDLAEMIVQLGHDRPSHIVVPAIHKNRAEIREIFLREMDDAPPDLTDDPQELAEAARRHLRRKFFESKVAISGANFAIAQTGSLLVAESEGNGRMCLTLPRTLISVVGIEKLIPTFRDLEVFLQLLPRSATGERMNPYNTVWTGVTPGDGPQEVHIVLLDNGRTNVLRDEIGRQALRCIRCAACLRVPRVPAHRRPRLRRDLPRTDRRRAHATVGRRRARLQAAVRVVAVRLLLRGLPGEDRHPDRVGQAAPRRRARPAPSRGGRRVRRRGRRDEGPQALDAGAEARPADALRAPRRAAAAVTLDRRARPARAAASVVSRLVGQGAPAAVSARDEVLARVRDAIGRDRAAQDVPREYRARSDDGIEQFIDRLHHYLAQTHRIPAGQLDEAVRTILADRGVRRIAVPAGIPDNWIEHVEPLRDEPALDAQTLDAVDGVITTCTVAIAQSGTIVLDGGPGMGRRILSLVPDYHLCVVRLDQLVGSLPEAIEKLDPTRPLTFISGPSATVDIEMVRVRGVHGPRRLEVILVTD